jgi:hypothetical protein
MPGVTPDTQPGSWGITLAPSNGTSYIGFVHAQSSGWQEGASQTLSSPLIAGTTYSFYVDIATTLASGSGIIPGCVELQVYGNNGGNSGCDQTELLWASGDVFNIAHQDQWVTHNVSFTPLANYSHMLFLVHSLGCTDGPYLMLDNLSDINSATSVGVYAYSSATTCYNNCDGSVNAIMVGGTPPFQYLWSPSGATTASDTGLCAGNYIVNVTDSNNVVYIDTVNIATGGLGTSPLSPMQLCMVSVDTSLNKNLIIWDKPISTQIDSFVVFKETNYWGNFIRIGAKGYNDFSTFVDMASNPAQQANRYKIAIMDSCGRTTIQSDAHKTIHLTISAGMTGTWNLNWDNYEGFLYSSLNIYRGTAPNNMIYLTGISSAMHSYSDLTPPPGIVYYLIEAIAPTSCNPTYKTGNVINSTLSNFTYATYIGVEESQQNSLFTIYPNPASNGINIQMNDSFGNNYTLQLVNLLGEVVYSKNKINQQTQYIETSIFSDGLYFIQIKTDKSISSKKIIIKKKKN